PKDGDNVYLTYTWDDNFRINIRHSKRQIEGFLINRSDENNAIYAFESQQNFIYFKYNLFNNTTNPLTLHASYLTTAGLRTNIFQDTTLVLSDLEESEWQFGLDQYYKFNDKHKLLAGMVWRNPNVDKARNNMSGKDERIISATDRNIIGIYLQDQYQFSDDIEITLGIRNDNYSDFGNTTNPRVALVYAINPKTRFKFMYGQAFRAPSFRQASTVVSLGNADIKPETVKTTEFAWLQEYSNVETILTLFHSQYKSKIDTVINSNNERIFTNTNDLNTNGLEFDITTTINNFNLRGTYTYLIDTEQEPRRVAKQTLSLIANYKLGAWNFNLNGFYHDEIEQDIRNNIIIHDGYWLWNNTIRYSLNKQLTLVSRINNLFDKEYYSSTKIQSFYEGIPNRGRTFFFGVEIVF
ncbi:MAG TPA: TonB-dependent receptor, partial [Thioploca sp.]|nr:TonB-dependent receptor [Thioploca sp.]